jgi:hypothetical protein
MGERLPGAVSAPWRGGYMLLEGPRWTTRLRKGKLGRLEGMFQRQWTPTSMVLGRVSGRRSLQKGTLNVSYFATEDTEALDSWVRRTNTVRYCAPDERIPIG